MFEPWLAVFLSNIFPGLGQIYCGQKKKGECFFFLEVFLLALLLASGVLFLYRGSVTWPFLILVAVYAAWLANLVDAYGSAKRTAVPQIAPARRKNPVLALFLSSLIPGAGQIYASHTSKGIGIMMLYYGLGHLAGRIKYVGLFLQYVVETGLLLYAILDAYEQASRRNGQPEDVFDRWSVRDIYRVLLVLLGFSLALSAYSHFLKSSVVELHKLPPYSDAMKPLLLPGDRYAVDNLTYRFSKPRRGDIVAFTRPGDPQKIQVKRIVGLPAEFIQLQGGNVYVNGKLIDTPQIPKARHYVSASGWRFGKEGQVIEIPSDSYFILGDNSEESGDSRQWGPIPKNHFRGKVFYVFWPFSRRGRLP